MSQTKWPLSSFPVLKRMVLEAREVSYTTRYEMIWGRPTVDFLFFFMPDMEGLVVSPRLDSRYKQEEDIC